jgi:tetratricopeptide (TPR) repeat protein
MDTMQRFAPPHDAGFRMVPHVDDLIRTIQSLGEDGGSRHARWLSALLHHRSPDVVSAAEQSLWIIWMQAGLPVTNQLLADAVEMIESEDFATAVALLELAIEEEPTFAELHHQRGLALASLSDSAAAVDAYAEALRLNPHHFAAAVGLGHAHVELSNWRAALAAYEQAIRIHPRLPEIPEAASQLSAALGISA